VGVALWLSPRQVLWHRSRSTTRIPRSVVNSRPRGIRECVVSLASLPAGERNGLSGHSGLIPASLITAAQRADSSRMNAPNHVGVPPWTSAPLFGEAPADFRRVEDLDKFGIKPLHDRLRRASGGDDPVPKRDVHPWVAEFGKGGDLRKQAMALAARRCKRTNLARSDERQQRRGRVEHDRSTPGNEVDHRWAAAALWHVQKIDRGESLEQLASEMRRSQGRARQSGFSNARTRPTG